MQTKKLLKHFSAHSADAAENIYLVEHLPFAMEKKNWFACCKMFQIEYVRIK